MRKILNESFLKTLCAHIPKPDNPVSVLAEALHLSRESAYRRLRGEVDFSFDEAATLSELLRFSLDKINNTNPRKDVLCRLKVIDFGSPIKAYKDYLERDIRFLQSMSADPSTVFASACNAIPPEFYLKYRSLSDFKLFKWLYQHELLDDTVRTFEQLQSPQSLYDVYASYIEGIRAIATNSYVFDNCGFRHWVNAIRAFRNMHLISEQTARQLREDLLLLADDLERIAIAGRYPNGNRVDFYLSEVNMESSYSYVSSSKYHAVCIGLFSLNALRTTDAGMFEYVKRWIKTQSKFATQISGCFERGRKHYFGQQREIIAQLDDNGPALV